MAMSAKLVIAAAAVAILAPACGSRAGTPLTPQEIASMDDDEWVVIERATQPSIRVRNVVIESTHISGVTEGGALREFPFESIRSVRAHTSDNVAMLALIPVAAVAIWLQTEASKAPERPKGESCPFVYVYDGRDYVFEAEPYGGAIVPALQRTEWTPLPHLRPVEGAYRLRLANQLDETQHIDEARLVVVDHPAGTAVAADPYGDIHVFAEPVRPSVVRDSRGQDLTGSLQEVDRQAWLSTYEDMDASIRETLRDPVTLAFPKPADARTVRLLVNGATSLWGAQVPRDFLRLRGRGLQEWYDELQASGPALEELVDWYAREGLYVLPIEVWTPAGWEERGALYGSGPFVYKSTAYALDVSDVPGDTLRVRLRVPVNFWVLNAVAADYSEPPAIEIAEVETSTLRDRRGRETRALLSAADDRALVLADRGDRVDLAYPVPASRPGMERTVFLKISGYYDIRIRAEGEPQEAVLRRVLREPGYTLRFAYERYLEGASRAVEAGSH